jgi:hypothetical protein
MTVGAWILGLLLAGSAFAAQPAAPFRHAPLGVRDGCFVESVAFYDALRERQGSAAWCRILQWGAKDDEEVVAGHAVAVFTHQGKLWGWDVNFGFAPLPIDAGRRDQPEVVAPPLTARYPAINPRFPLYRHDFDQLPDSTPPSEVGGSENPALREASRVAVRLAKHRPVNLVAYTHVRDGQTLASAACVFLFHGRLCVYVPGYGTVPFRARALSVENLRQLQQALRTIHPGAANLQAL